MSLSAAFTQTRLLRPDGVKILFLMLTYLSTLRLKTGFFLVRPEKCVFCKFAQHQPSPSLRSGEFKEGDATTSSSWRLKHMTCKLSAYGGLSRRDHAGGVLFCYSEGRTFLIAKADGSTHTLNVYIFGGIWLKRNSIRSESGIWHYAARREIT